MQNKKIFVLLFLLALAALARPVWAQSPDELTLSLSRDFGYSSGTGKIQGLFTIKASGPEDLAKVVFLIDGKPIGEATSSPFKQQFDTSNYSLGVHTLGAIGTTRDGRELQAAEQTREFVPASTGMETVAKIILPLLAVLGLAAFFSYMLPALLGRGKAKSLAPGAARSYAPLGGAICPKCGRPFAVHIYGLNLVVGKLDRCPYCGKWSLVTRASPAQLREAEAAELDLAQESGVTSPETSPEEKLRKDLDNSRYQDL